jgi:transcription initiation factor TFIIH subunit 2
MESVEDVVLGEGVSASGAATEEELLGLDDHSWLQWFQKSWLDIEERVDGRLVNPDSIERKVNSRTYAEEGRVAAQGGVAIKKGLIRFMFIVIDFSASMRQTDYKPVRSDYIFNEVSSFIEKFFDKNPLSYISLISMREGGVHFITRMNGQPNFQIKKLKEYIQANPPSGTCSVVKAIDLVLRTGDLPLYASKEILVLWGSLSSVDSVQAPIHPYLSERLASQGGLDITVISMSPELYALKKISTKFVVAMSPTDFREKLSTVVNPKQNAQAKPVYIKMGFPLKTVNGPLTKCSCHLDLHSTLFTCPQCKSLVCEIPTNCPVCKLTLVERDMLTRIHRLLYDMPTFSQIDVEDGSCNACCTAFDISNNNTAVRCNECNEVYCYDCDKFSHEKLRHCLGCLSRS